MALLVLSLSPYRLAFYRSLARLIQKRGYFLILQRNPSQASHRWSPFRGGRQGHLHILTTGPDKSLYLELNSETNLKKPWVSHGPRWASFRSLLQARPSVVACYDFSPYCWPALLWKILFQVPLVLATEVGPRSQKKLWILKRWHQNLFLRRADLVLAHTKDASRWPRALFAPHAVDSSVFRPLPRQSAARPPTVVFVGVPDRRKGIDLLAEAFAVVRGKISARCRIVGVTPETQGWVEFLFRERGLLADLELFPFCEGHRLRKAYQTADLFVLPSRFDTFGVVVHEAACCGLPLLVSRYAGACESLVHKGVNGFIINPYQTRDFANKMEKILRNKKLRDRMSLASRKIGHFYDVRGIAEQVARKLTPLFREHQRARTSR